MQKLIMLVAVSVFVITGVGIIQNFWDNARMRRESQELGMLFYASEPPAATLSQPPPEVEAVEEEKTEKNLSNKMGNFDFLLQHNADTVAWLSVPGTEIDVPVVQSVDNQYYLKHDYGQQASKYGTPFLDCRNKLPGLSDHNYLIYGHNMKDGLIFAQLLQYADVDFAAQNAVVRLQTPEEITEWVVWAAFYANVNPALGEPFEYIVPNFDSDEVFLSFIDRVRVRSLMRTDITVDAADPILTLSTCSYNFADERFVVMARKIRSNEAEKHWEECYAVNAQPLYPDIWYGKEKDKPDEIELLRLIKNV